MVVSIVLGNEIDHLNYYWYFVEMLEFGIVYFTSKYDPIIGNKTAVSSGLY